MPLPPDLDEYMKRVPGGTSRGAGGGTPGTTTAEPADTGEGGESTLHSVVAAPFRAARGVAKGVVSAAESLDPNRWIEPYLPGGERATAAREAVRAPMRDWAAESGDEGIPESVGRFIGESAPYALIPGEVGLAARGAQYLRPLYAAVRGPGGRMMRNPSWLASAARQAYPYLAGRTGRVLEQGAIGAGAGAIADPGDPASGAMAGAAAGAVPGAASPFMQSTWGHYLGGHGLRHGIIQGGLHVMGAPALIEALVHGAGVTWYFSPAGRRLHHLGEYIIDETGRLLGRFNRPALPGAAAGSLAGSLNTGPPLTQEQLDEAGVTQGQGGDQQGGSSTGQR